MEKNQDLVNAVTTYPQIDDTQLDNCELCHSSGSALNSYGADYQANGRNVAAFGAIEAIDSDGDGFVNGDEITTLTFPGDPESFASGEYRVFLPLIPK